MRKLLVVLFAMLAAHVCLVSGGSAVLVGLVLVFAIGAVVGYAVPL